jgi:beta-galactosidase
MRHTLLIPSIFALAVTSLPAATPHSSSSARQTTELSAGWRFTQGDPADAEAVRFDDAGWKTVSVPHDWAIAQPFDKDSKTGGAGAFLPGGVSWYRRRLDLPKVDGGKRIFVEFDGVMAHSKVWLNGHLVGERPSGYVSFGYELTPFVNFGGQNVLAVRTDTSLQPASRWYEGAGIYRKVRLVVEDPLHVARWGTYVTTPSVSAAQAQVRVQASVQNQSAQAAAASVRVRLVAPNGRVAAMGASEVRQIGAGTDAAYDVRLTVRSPERWDVGHPAMYHAVVEVLTGDKVRDTDSASFGIREFHFDAATGFWLNGRNFKLYGVCLHGDDSGFGIAVPAEATRERFEALKALGVNAIRVAHSAPSPEFLDEADKQGLLVMDELFDMWSLAKNPYDYHLDFPQWHVQDTKDMAMRDRNHPSIILWSAGNEIRDTPKAELAKEELGSILLAFHEVDPSRPVTQALFRPNVSHDYEDGLADMLDVVGQNYRTNEILAAHAQKPTRKIVGTENAHDRDQWLALRDHAFFSGEFLWSGTDYLGEARQWPGISRSTGLLDRTNAPHVRGLERESWWSAKPVVHIARRTKPTPKAPTDPGYELQQMGDAETVFADWTPESLAPHDENVEVYSNCASVELLLNGQSLGSKPIHEDASARTWTVAFVPGTLRAVCRDAAKTQETLTTAGRPDHITLSAASRQVGSGFDDVVEVRAVVVDAAGVRVPRTAQELTFAVRGPGQIVAVDNSDIASHEPFQAAARAAYDGTAVVYVRATPGVGQIRVSASADGLKSGSAMLRAGTR